MEDILTAEQVAQILQVHPFTVLKFIKQGKLKASKLGRVYRIRKSDVDSFLDNQVERSEKASEKQEIKRKEKKQPVEEKKKPLPPSDRVEGRGTVESEIVKETIGESQRDDRRDIDHYIIELKAN